MSPSRTDGTDVTQATSPAPARTASASAATTSSSNPSPRRPRCTAGHQPPSPKRASAHPGSTRTSSGILRIDPDASGAIFLTSSSIGAERRCRPASSTSAGSGGASNRGAVHTAQRPQSCGLRIVELLLEDAHEAAPVGPELLHRALFLAAQRGDARVALAVIAPVRRLGRHPARAVPAQRALDVEDLQHRLQPAAADVDHAQQLLRAAAGVSGGGKVLEHRGDPLARRERLLDEEVLDPPVLDAAQQDHVGVIDAATGAADLLVVGHHGTRGLVMDDEGEVGLVVAHPQRARGTDRLDVVGQQPFLGRDAVRGVLIPAVGQCTDALRVEERRHLIGVALGQGVDDPGAVDGAVRAQILGQPGQPLRGPGQVDDLQAQARARQRPAVGAQRRVAVGG